MRAPSPQFGLRIAACVAIANCMTWIAHCGGMVLTDTCAIVLIDACALAYLRTYTKTQLRACGRCLR
eukprot:5138894-Alexandrium_andersonii.AAC.1